ncbi:MAG TPA: ATP-dependent Clp protease adapter ClpS [Candidatus Ozemobacteraceae bacterium]|nr:ATP-dependent Clp protease adapter ClpS [Candidatus Ozemobacteraceae bacterium]
MAGTSSRPDQELLEKTRQKNDEPPMYRVFLLNDDYTTMEFVIEVLQNVFHLPTMEATQIMLHVHRNGRGLAGVYVRDIAETKVETVRTMARERGYPLQCAMEKA